MALEDAEKLAYALTKCYAERSPFHSDLATLSQCARC